MTACFYITQNKIQKLFFTIKTFFGTKRNPGVTLHLFISLIKLWCFYTNLRLLTCFYTVNPLIISALMMQFNIYVLFVNKFVTTFDIMNLSKFAP